MERRNTGARHVATIALLSMSVGMGCGAPTLSSEAESQVEAYDGTTIFRGVFFDRGPAAADARVGRPTAALSLDEGAVAKQLDALSHHYRAKALTASTEAARRAASVLRSEGVDLREASPRERDKLIQLAIRRIHASDSTFFRRFGIAMRTGDSRFVARALEEASARLFAAGLGRDEAETDAASLASLKVDVEEEQPELAFKAKKAKKKKVAKSKKKVKRKKAKAKKKSGASGKKSEKAEDSLENGDELDDEFMDDSEAPEDELTDDDDDDMDPDDDELEDDDDDDGFEPEDDGDDVDDVEDPDDFDDDEPVDDFDDADEEGGGDEGGGDDTSQAFKARGATSTKAVVVLGRVHDKSAASFYAWRFSGTASARAYAEKLGVAFTPR